MIIWINRNISLQLRSILQHKLNISPFRKLCQIPSCRTCDATTISSAQHASELSRRHLLYAPRASVVPRRTFSACAPGRLDRGLCASRHTDASVDRDLTREASTIYLVLRPGPSRARARRCGRAWSEARGKDPQPRSARREALCLQGGRRGAPSAQLKSLSMPSGLWSTCSETVVFLEGDDDGAAPVQAPVVIEEPGGELNSAALVQATQLEPAAHEPGGLVKADCAQNTP